MMQENRTSLRVPADTTVQKTMSRRHVTTLESSDWTRLELRDVSKSFVDASGHNVSVLSNISLTIDRGDFYCLLGRSEEHTSELQSLMRISYAVFCLKKKNKPIIRDMLIISILTNTQLQNTNLITHELSFNN